MKHTKVRSCSEWAEYLAAPHPDNLPAEVRTALDAHLQTCESCQAVRTDYQRVGKLIESLPDLSMPSGLPPKLLEEWGGQGWDDDPAEPIETRKGSAQDLQAQPPLEKSEEVVHLRIEIGHGSEAEYLVTLRSLVGSAHGTFHLPGASLKDMPDWQSLATYKPEAIQHFGQQLFEALFRGNTYKCYTESLRVAERRQIPMRLNFFIHTPELERLPWELLYDPHLAEYLSLIPDLQLVRVVDGPSQPARSLARMRPLRLLGINTSWSVRQGARGSKNKRKYQPVPKAFASLQDYGLVEWREVAPKSWQEVLEQIQAGPWYGIHIAPQISPDRQAEDIHFILGAPGEPSQRVKASSFAQDLIAASSVQVVVLEPPTAPLDNQQDSFSSLAKLLVRMGIPAVLSMPDQISEQAQELFIQFFYEGQAQGRSVGAATAKARRVSAPTTTSLPEWATAVLYLSALEG